MRIGIITFHRAINYGAVLQTYALQTELNNIGVENKIIDYRNKKIENKYWSIIPKVSFKEGIRLLLLTRRNKIKRNKFLKFINDNIELTEKCVNHKELEELNEKCDEFITGSDQVWHYYPTNFDKAYFLDFVHDSSKKNSYAASFAMSELPNNYKGEYKNLLEDFNNISVREKNGCKIIKDLIYREVPVVLDPTFLLSREEWNRIAINPKEEDYILIYIMKGSNSIFEFAKRLAVETGCKIKYISNGLKRPIKGEYIATAGIEEFIGLFNKAKYVITNSFHGLAFSLIMNKNFFLELQKPPAANDRLEFILDYYELNERKIIDGENNSIHSSINYDEVNKKLDRERKKSIDYLFKIVTS